MEELLTGCCREHVLVAGFQYTDDEEEADDAEVALGKFLGLDAFLAHCFA